MGKHLALALLLAVATLWVVVGCTAGDSPQEIEGRWELDQMTTAAEFDVSTLGMWLEFGPDGRLAGQGACNDIQGKYGFDGADLEFGEVTVSAVGCDTSLDDATNVEQALFAVLWSDEPIEVAFTDDQSMEWDTSPALTFRR